MCYLLSYRPALMTIVDGIYKVRIHVESKLIEKILLNISPDQLKRIIGKISACHQEVILGESINFSSVDSIMEQQEH